MEGSQHSTHTYLALLPTLLHASVPGNFTSHLLGHAFVLLSATSPACMIGDLTFNALAHGWLTGTLVPGVVPTTIRGVSLPVTGTGSRDTAVGGVTLVARAAEALAVTSSPLCALQSVVVPGPVTARETLVTELLLGDIRMVVAVRTLTQVLGAVVVGCSTAISGCGNRRNIVCLRLLLQA